MAIYMAESQALQSACEVFGSVCISTFALIAIKTNKGGGLLSEAKSVCVSISRLTTSQGQLEPRIYPT